MDKFTEEHIWSEYYQLMCGHPPHEPLLKALDFFRAEDSHDFIKFAVDLGCGSGNDSLELLRQGWKVLAIDREEEALAWLKSGISAEQQQNLESIRSDFKDILIPDTLLINAGFSLPFCNPDDFPSLWQKIGKAIVPGGRFSGHFFGKNDGYAKDPTNSIHSKDQVNELFKEFEIEFFEERDQEGTTIGGIEKHWHVFAVVAKKK